MLTGRFSWRDPLSPVFWFGNDDNTLDQNDKPEELFPDCDCSKLGRLCADDWEAGERGSSDSDSGSAILSTSSLRLWNAFPSSALICAWTRRAREFGSLSSLNDRREPLEFEFDPIDRRKSESCALCIKGGLHDWSTPGSEALTTSEGGVNFVAVRLREGGAVKSESASEYPEVEEFDLAR